MALGYFPVVPILLLLESAKITGEATTQLTTSPPTSVPTSEPHHFTSLSDTTGGTETTTPTAGTTKFLPSSVALLSEPNRPWSILGERSTPDDTAASSLATTSIPSASFGGPSKEGVTLSSESTLLLIRSTAQEMNSSSRPPTPLEKMTSEGPSTTISTTSPAETPSEKHASSLPPTTETITTSPLSFPLLTSTLVTSTRTSATSGLGDTTGSSEVSMASEAPSTRWWPGSSLFPTYSSVTQDGSTQKVTSTGLLSSKPGRTSLGLFVPSSTNPTSEFPAATMTVVPSIPTSPSASTSLREIAGEGTTQVTTSPPSMSTSEPHHFTSVSDTTGGTETTTPVLKSTEYLPSSMVLLSGTTRPRSTLGKTSLPSTVTTLFSSYSPEWSAPAGTPDVTASSSSLHPMSSIPSTAFGGPSEEGTAQPVESTVLIVSSTIPRSPTAQDKMTSEGLSATISTKTQAETTREKHTSSPPITAETTKASPFSVPLPTSSLATTRRPSGSTGVGHTTGFSEVTTASEAEITSWWPQSSLSSTYFSVAQDRSTRKVISPGLLSSNPGRSSLGLSTPSSTTPSSESPATPFKLLSSTTISTSASKSLQSTRGEGTTQLATFPPTSVPTSEPHLFTSVSDTTGGTETTTPAVGTTKFLPSSMALLSEPNRPWSILGERSTPDDTAASSLATTSIPSASFGGPSEEGVTLSSESTVLLIRSTAHEMNSSSRPPTPLEKMTSEGPLTTISTTSPAETLGEKHASSLPPTTDTITTSPLSFPLLTSTLLTSTPTSATSGLGNTTGSSEVSMASEAPSTRWWPGSSPFPTYSSVTQDGSTPKVTSVGLLSSKPGRSSLGPCGPSSTNPTSPGTTLKVLPPISQSPSASEGFSQAPARNRFILSVRFSTTLNIADLSVRHAMLKWLDHELQTRLSVGSFHLTWVG